MNKTNHFIITKEFRRFKEFCDACFRYRYIGICYGPPGVGKTMSARKYTKWDMFEPLFQEVFSLEQAPNEAMNCHTMFYTAPVVNSPSKIVNELERMRFSFSTIVDKAHTINEKKASQHDRLSLIVDEVDRLNIKSIEQLRELYDRRGIGLILLGMPGLEKRISRYPQLYSRIGFAHEFKTISQKEMRFILQNKWKELGLSTQQGDFTDEEAISAIIRITGGNFRLIHRLFMQIERILEINQLKTITKEVVETARENLVIGNI
jgi:DNA transposition AAA+ family ATPase